MFNHKNKINQKIISAFVAIALVGMSLVVGIPETVQAQSSRDTCEAAGGSWRQLPGAPTGVGSCTCPDGSMVSSGSCAEADASNSTGAMRDDIEADCTASAEAKDCGITRYLVLFINVLSVLAGIVIAASIAYGGIQYSTSGSDPQRVSAAKDRIRNAIIALVFFIFGYSILNYLIPGGLL